MKKFKVLIAILVAVAPILGADAASPIFRSYSFLSDQVRGITNGVYYTGIQITNAAAAPLGGYTNVNSWMGNVQGVAVQTNAFPLTYTNINGVWIIPTNGALLSSALIAGKVMVTNDSSLLTKDITLWTLENGNLPGTTATNNFSPPDANNLCAISQVTLSTRFVAASGATGAGSLTYTFVGLPDGVNESTRSDQTWAVSFTPLAGLNLMSTNFPIWKFAGCGKVRLKTAVNSNASAASIGLTINELSLNGWIP